MSCASAPAANAAASSLRTWIQSMPPFAGAAGAPHRVDDRVEAVADDPVDAVDARVDELGDELVCDCRGHAPHSTPGADPTARAGVDPATTGGVPLQL